MAETLRKIFGKRPNATPDIQSLETLTEDILEFLVKEAENLLQAQFQSHLSTNQRGYVIAGLMTTAASAVATAIFAMMRIEIEIRYWPTITLFLSLISGSILSIISVWPRPFSFPGSEPVNWLPDTWPSRRKTTKLAKFEKLKISQIQIFKNKIIAKRKAYWQMAALACPFFGSIIFAVTTL